MRRLIALADELLARAGARALSNLIDNALRHGAGDITIEIRASVGGAVLTVTDEGPGFPPDDTSHPGGTRTRVRVELASPRD